MIRNISTNRTLWAVAAILSLASAVVGVLQPDL